MSAGFDAAAGDPLGEAAVTPAGFGRMTRALAHEVQGRLLLALEGGYSLSQLPRCAAACVRALLDEPPCALETAADIAGADCCEAGRAAVRATLRAHAVHWPGLAAHTHPPAKAIPLPLLLPAAASPRSRGRVSREVQPRGRGSTTLSTTLSTLATLEVGGGGAAVTREEVNSLPDFAHVLPADYRSGYMAWRCGKPRGAKGEARARGGGGGGGGGDGGVAPPQRFAYPRLARAI